MDFLGRAALAFACNAEVEVMRYFMSPNFLAARSRKPMQKRQMRERRTAQALIIFGIVLATVELYVILGGF
jgi:hypothetical protein